MTQSFGLLLGTIVMVPKTAQTIASVVMLTFVLTGGYFVTSIPAWIGWLSEFLVCIRTYCNGCACTAAHKRPDVELPIHKLHLALDPVTHRLSWLSCRIPQLHLLRCAL